MAVGIVNPLSAVQSYRNQQLGAMTQGRGINVNPGPGRTAQEALSASQPKLGGLNNIRERASNQHNLFLQAVKANQQRQAAAARQMGGSSLGRGGWGPAGNGAMNAPYKLTQGTYNALTNLNNAYRNQFGKDLIINSGGRTYQEQAQKYAAYKAGRGNLAARPGTSVHESGRAIDFGGPIQNARSREHIWLQQNAGNFGFVWSGKNFSQFEPWHWEFHG